MRAHVPLWEPPITSADDVEVQFSTDGTTWVDATPIGFTAGTWPEHPMVATVDIAATAAPLVRHRWTSGSDYVSAWYPEWRIGALAPEWLWPHDLSLLSTSRYVCDENVVTLSRMIRQARLAICQDLGDITTTEDGATEALRQASLRMVEWIGEIEAAQTISTATGLQQEKIGSYSYYRNETAHDAWMRVAGSVPYHVEAILEPYVTDPLHPVTLQSIDVFDADFDPYDPTPAPRRYAWDD